MKCPQFKLTIFMALLVFLAESAFALPAFPGAEGFGANTIGGRGGKVIKVTNLNDSGEGSFRDAINASGPRTVVFEVSGIINLQSNLLLSNPYITIAGQTSPGGILVAGRTFTVNTHDVIVRHIRFRAGSHNVADAEKHDTVQVLGEYWARNSAYNIIFDHCSISWGIDENMSVSGGVTNMTVQWSIVSEGLSNAGHPKGEHSKGLFISGKYELPNSVSLHHNYIAHNQDRNPYISSPNDVDTVVDVVNNVVYNWKGGLAPLGGGSAKINWVNNYAKQGQASNSYSREITHTASGASVSEQLYVMGNIGSTRMSQSEPQWNVGNHWRNEDLSTGWRKNTPWEAPRVTASEMSAAYASEMLEQVGATQPVRDSVDARVVASFNDGSGNIIGNVRYPDDFPVFENIAPPADKDNDGMADSWELQNGLNTSIDDSALDANGNGYTNLEEYLHFLANDGVLPVATARPEAPPNLEVTIQPE